MLCFCFFRFVCFVFFFSQSWWLLTVKSWENLIAFHGCRQSDTQGQSVGSGEKARLTKAWKLSSRLFSRPARLTAPRSPRMGCRGTRQFFAQKPLFVQQNLTFERNSKFVCYYYSLSLLRSCFRTKSAKWTNFLRTYAPSVLTLSPSGRTKRLTVISK